MPRPYAPPVSVDSTASSAQQMSREAWVLFAALSFVWGIPYLLIKVAVIELFPAAVASGRTLLASVILIPLAASQSALRPALRLWPWVVAFGVIEMAVPWLLLGRAEQRVSSGFAGLMLATVPIVGASLAWLRREPHALAPVRLVGLGVGILGVALVGLDSLAGQVDLVSVVELLVVAVGYAVAPVIAARRLAGVDSIGVIAISVAVVAQVLIKVLDTQSHGQAVLTLGSAGQQEAHPGRGSCGLIADQCPHPLRATHVITAGWSAARAIDRGNRGFVLCVHERHDGDRRAGAVLRGPCSVKPRAGVHHPPRQAGRCARHA